MTEVAPVRRRHGHVECALCGTTLFGITTESKVWMIWSTGTGDHPAMRAVMVDGREVHRCSAMGREPAVRGESV
jgi:hypothetical protein